MATISNTPSYTADHFWAQRQAQNEAAREAARQARDAMHMAKRAAKSTSNLEQFPTLTGGNY